MAEKPYAAANEPHQGKGTEARAADSLAEAAEKALGGLSAFNVLAATPRRLRSLLSRSYFQHSLPRTPDGRTLAQTLYHLADSEAVFSVQLKSALVSNEARFAGYDQDLWLKRVGDRPVRIEPTLERFASLRAENLETCADLTAAEFEAVADLVRTRAGHDLLHLNPLEEAVAGPSQEASLLRGVPMARDNPFELPTKRGRLIVICGIDGAGKTSQSLELVDWLQLCGLNAIYHKPIGIRSDLDFLAERLGRKNHVDLFGADTARLLRATARWVSMTAACAKLCDDTSWLVMDRYAYCEYAATRSQGASNEWLLRVMYAGLPTPDLTLFFDVSPEEAFRRVSERGVDNEALDDLRAFDAAYRGLPEMELFTLLDGTGDFAAVRSRVRTIVRTTFPELRATEISD
jgi:dTMP kinase